MAKSFAFFAIGVQKADMNILRRAVGQGTVKTPGIEIPGIFPVVIKFHEISLTKQSFRPDPASFTPGLE